MHRLDLSPGFSPVLFTTLLLLVCAAPLAVLLCGRLRPWAAGAAALVAAVAAFALAVAAWRAGPAELSLPWIPVWQITLRFTYDGLAALYTMLATGIGAIVLLFATRYMPAHAHESQWPPERLTGFYALMSLFMAAMVGLTTTRELYALTIFWDLTAITSFLLIAIDWRRDEARDAAQVALLVTAGPAVLLLLAVVLVHVTMGTTDVAAVIARAPAGWVTEAVVVLVSIAALAKSAQVPLHFWLPRAMVAPTPVSAYLHSAAMVAAGVFLLSLFQPLIARSQSGSPLLVGAGAASILTGSALALTARTLKQILAYSTIAQYGYVVVMIGLGGAAGASGAAYYVLAHAVAKSALFMTAGAATEAMGGETDLRRMGGLFSRMPVWAAGSAICAAALAGLPLTAGYFKDELFFRTAAHQGPVAVAFAVGAAALTLAYTWRWWSGIFLGSAASRYPHHLLSPVPVLVLAVAAVAGGVANAAYARLAEAAAAVIGESVEPIPAVPHLQITTEVVMALAAYLVGVLVILARWLTAWPWRAAERAGNRIGPDRLYRRAGWVLSGWAARLHELETRDLRGRLAAVLLPGAAIVGLSLPVAWSGGLPHAGELHAMDAPLVAALVLVAVAAIGSTTPRRHLTLVLASSVVTYALAALWVLLGAPDVALVMVVVQTAVGLLILAMLSVFPADLLHAAAEMPARHRPGLLATGAAGVGAFAVAWVTLSGSAPADTPDAYLDLAHAAHARDVVTALLADFRGLDTLGEATVLATALLGLATLLIQHWRAP